MAATALNDPYENLRKNLPRVGQAQNTGGLAKSMTDLSQRPVAPPAIRAGTPGPAPIGGIAPPPAPATTPQQPGGVIRIGAPQAPAGPAAPPPPPPDLYGKEGGGGLEGQIRGALGGMFGGLTSKSFIDRAKQQLGAATEAQRAQGVRRIDEDAIKRGLFKSGIPAELSAATGTAAQGSFAAGLADILNQAEQQDIQGRQFATGAATNLLGMNRSYDEAAQARADAMANRGGGGPAAPQMITIIDPDTGQAYELPEDVLQF